MRHGSIDWLALYISLIAAIMLVFGIVWSVSPMHFVNGYRALIFRDKVTRAKWWGICGLQYFRSCGRRYGRLLRSLHPLSVVDGRVSLDRAVTPASVPPESNGAWQASSRETGFSLTSSVYQPITRDLTENARLCRHLTEPVFWDTWIRLPQLGRVRLLIK